MTKADINKPGKSKRKYDYEQGEPEPWEQVLLALNDLKSEVDIFRKLLIERGIMHEDPPRRSNQQVAAGKENVRDPKSKNQRPDKFAGTAVKCKGKDKSGHAPSYLPELLQELQSDSRSEEVYASVAMVRQRPQLRINYRALNAHCHKDMEGRLDQGPACNGVEVQTSALAFMCLADDDLAGS